MQKSGCSVLGVVMHSAENGWERTGVLYWYAISKQINAFPRVTPIVFSVLFIDIFVAVPR